MRKESRYDRQVRMLKIEHLLYQCGEAGMLVTHLAETCNVSLRTTQRDLSAIEASNVFPIWRLNGRCGIVIKQYLPPIRFTPSEALNLFMASRLMLNFAQRYDPNIASIFIKLNCVMPSPLREQVQQTITWMNTLTQNSKVVQTLGRLAEAWTTGHKVRISYRALNAEKASFRDIEPYFIQPVSPSHSAFVLARCGITDEPTTFKVERIESITILPETYAIPPAFDANRYFSAAWGIVVDGEVKTVKLRIIPEIARIFEESVWHPSQRVEKKKDGSVIMTLHVNYTTEFVSWILGWGEKLEVLEPENLRREIAEIAEETAKIYRKIQRQTR